MSRLSMKKCRHINPETTTDSEFNTRCKKCEVILFISDFIIFCKNSRQRLMRNPTDPKEIHRRAELIRLKLDHARKEAKEKARIEQQMKIDLDLIEFDRRIKNAQPSKFFKR